MKEYTYKDCIITHEDSKVWKQYIVDGSKEYHTGIDICASKVYTPCFGVVVQSCLIDEHQSVIVQYDGHISLRFSHLKESYVNLGQIVDFDQCIGEADRYVHFEYLTSEEIEPSFRVFVAQGLVLYKHDPRIILDRNIIFDNYVVKLQKVELFGETLEELSNNRGI